jgi:nucleoid-associated protein YgaU
MFGSKKKIEELEAELAKARKTAEEATKAKAADAAAAKKKVEDLQAQMKDLKAKESKQTMEDRAKKLEERRAEIADRQKQANAKEHTVAEGETLSHVALKYYGSATPPYWQFLLENNKEVLKDNERNVRTGMKLVIPELPEDLKK